MRRRDDFSKPVSWRYHVTVSGALYVGVTAMLAVGAINSQNNLLYIALGLALGAILASGVISGAMLMGLRVERDAPVRGEVGAPLVIRYTIRNKGRLAPAFALCVTEVERWRGDGGRRGAAAKAGRATWAERMPAPMAFAAHVGRGKAVVVEAVVCPERRGDATFRALRVTSAFPFGVLRKSVIFAQEHSALIRPEAAAPPAHALRRALSQSEHGAMSRVRVGRGVEYLGVREYTPGDSMRRIAWRNSARTGELLVRETMSPASKRVWIGLETLAQGGKAKGRAKAGSIARRGAGAIVDPMEEANERAISLAAGLIVEAQRAGVETGLVAPALGLRRLPGRWSAAAALDDLARLDCARRREGEREAFNVRDSVVVAHAGRVSAEGWPAGATHISARVEDEKEAAP